MMYSRHILVLLLAGVGSVMIGQHQSHQVGRSTPHSLAIRLEPGVRSADGFPSTFSIALENLTDHDILIPRPAVNCKDLNVGSIYLDVGFGSESFSHGDCIVETIHSPLEERITSWETLHPGASLRIENLPLPKQEDKYTRVGTYYFSATYLSPAVDHNAQEALSKRGIFIAFADIKTDVLRYKKEQ